MVVEYSMNAAQSHLSRSAQIKCEGSGAVRAACTASGAVQELCDADTAEGMAAGCLHWILQGVMADPAHPLSPCMQDSACQPIGAIWPRQLLFQDRLTFLQVRTCTHLWTEPVREDEHVRSSSEQSQQTQESHSQAQRMPSMPKVLAASTSCTHCHGVGLPAKCPLHLRGP